MFFQLFVNIKKIEMITWPTDFIIPKELELLEILSKDTLPDDDDDTFYIPRTLSVLILHSSCFNLSKLKTISHLKLTEIKNCDIKTEDLTNFKSLYMNFSSRFKIKKIKFPTIMDTLILNHEKECSVLTVQKKKKMFSDNGEKLIVSNEGVRGFQFSDNEIPYEVKGFTFSDNSPVYEEVKLYNFSYNEKIILPDEVKKLKIRNMDFEYKKVIVQDFQIAFTNISKELLKCLPREMKRIKFKYCFFVDDGYNVTKSIDKHMNDIPKVNSLVIRCDWIFDSLECLHLKEEMCVLELMTIHLECLSGIPKSIRHFNFYPKNTFKRNDNKIKATNINIFSSCLNILSEDVEGTLTVDVVPNETFVKLPKRVNTIKLKWNNILSKFLEKLTVSYSREIIERIQNCKFEILDIRDFPLHEKLTKRPFFKRLKKNNKLIE